MKPKTAARGGTLFLIDGNSFCYRAFYAIRNLTTSRGEPANAIYGFVTMIRKLIQDYHPDHLAVCFDRKEPTFRHERYPDYKIHRKPMPDDLVEQIEPIKNFCRAYRYEIFEAAGYEADDLIGTLAFRAEKEGFTVFIVTGDKDAMQLVTEKTHVLNPHKEGKIYDPAGVRTRFEGLGADQVVDLMALMGDASDNIPGVPGIGEKTALKLIREFGSIEELYRHLDRVKSKTQQLLLKEHEKSALLSKELARIDISVPLEVDWDAMRLRDPDRECLVELVKHYEFRTLLKDIIPDGETHQSKRSYRIVNEENFESWLGLLKKAHTFSFDTETTSSDPMRAALVGMSFCWEPFQAYYLPVSSESHKGPGLPLEKVLGELKPVLASDQHAKYGQNLKYDLIVMKRHGIALGGIAFDTMIASYLVNPVKRNHNLDDISLEYLGVKKIPTEALLGTGKKQIRMDEVPLEKIAEYAAEDADCVFRLVPVLREKLQADGLTKLFLEVELPLLQVLAEMEMNGVALDREALQKLSAQAGGELTKLTEDIYAEAGQGFNINSPKQLSEILFGKMGYPVVKSTKTGFSTDVNVLEKLAENYDLPRKILDYRERAKLKSTYLDALPEMVHPETGRVHTSYHQTTTATGRLSSSEPNLQNIPVKTESGRRVRKAFVPRLWDKAPGKIVAADYSQIELRILAHFSEDPHLLEAFREGRDIHNFTATLLYPVGPKDVTREMRHAAKTINFSILYGKTAYGLSQDLGISVSEADLFIENYFKRYARVRECLEAIRDNARRDGYVTTLLGRRAYFPDIHSKNTQLRQFAERAAVNAPFQGSAADLIKAAMIRISARLREKEMRALMVMQVHDELVFDAPAEEKGMLEGLVKNEMEQAVSLKVPLEVDLFSGDSWYKE